jgi:hypothetical protein
MSEVPATVLVRHLVLPNNSSGTKQIVEFLRKFPRILPERNGSIPACLPGRTIPADQPPREPAGIPDSRTHGSGCRAAPA